YRVESLGVDTPWGERAAPSLRLGTEAPHAVVGDASLATSAARLGVAGLRDDAPPIAVAATVGGDLAGLRVEARAQAGAARAQATLGLDPLAPALAGPASRLEFSGVDPAAWLPGAPAASLAGRAWVDEAAPLRGRVEIDNAAARPLPQGGVPVA